MRLGETPAGAVDGGGIGQLRRQARQVVRNISEDRRGGFDREVMAMLLERFAEADDVRHDHRLAAGEDDVSGVVRPDLGHDIRDRPLASLGIPARVWRVAPGAAQVAPAGPDEHRRHANELAFALYGVKEFGDAHESFE